MSIELVPAFLLGFWGSLHCVGMCGGIVGVLNNSLAATTNAHSRKLMFWLAYNFGRIASYAVAGGLAAMTGSSLLAIIDPDVAHRLGQMVSGLFLLAFGLYLSGWWLGLGWFEKTGAMLWRRLSPLTSKFVPVRQLHQALCLGALWGWLPCGLVYSALAWTFTLPGFAAGMMQMAVFGLGTLPMLLLMSGAAGRVAQLARHHVIRKSAGVIVMLFGIVTFLGVAPMHSGHDHSHHSIHTPGDRSAALARSTG